MQLESGYLRSDFKHLTLYQSTFCRCPAFGISDPLCGWSKWFDMARPEQGTSYGTHFNLAAINKHILMHDRSNFFHKEIDALQGIRNTVGSFKQR